MKLGVFTCLLGNLPLEEALGYFKSKGLEMVEIGCGGYPEPNSTMPNGTSRKAPSTTNNKVFTVKTTT